MFCSLNLTSRACHQYSMRDVKLIFRRMGAFGRGGFGELLSIWKLADCTSRIISNRTPRSVFRRGSCSGPCGTLITSPASAIRSIRCSAACWGSLAALTRRSLSGPVKRRLPGKMQSSPEYYADTTTELSSEVCGADCSSSFRRNQSMKRSNKCKL